MPLMSGIFVAMVTPFTDNQEIDYKRTAKLLDHLMASDIAGVFILGTNGEAYLLSAEKKLSLVPLSSIMSIIISKCWLVLV